MAFTPHWIDSFSNGVSSNLALGARSENIVRIGDVLYGLFYNFDSGTGDSDGSFSTRKSTDSGVTWTDLGVAPASLTASSNEWFTVCFPRLGKMEAFLVSRNYPSFNNIQNIYWTTYDPIGNTWSTPVSTGLPMWFRPVGGLILSTFFAGLRPDGTILICFQDGGTFDLRISKWTSPDSPSTWTTLGGFFDGSRADPMYLESGTFDDDGNAHAFIARTHDDGTGHDVRDLIHFSVAAATDAISAEHTIETNIDRDDDWGNYGGSYIGPGDAKGTTIAVPYGYFVGYNQINGVPYGTLRVGIGDLTSDPLNPSWSVTTVLSNALSSSSSNHNYVQAQNVILSGVLWAYWITTYPYSNPLDSQTRLWRSYWTGSAWNTPELWYDPDTDSTLSTAGLEPYSTFPIAVSNFYLLKAFTNGVGIILNVLGQAVSFPDPFQFAAYDGPSMAAVSGRRTFAFQPTSGMPVASHSRTSRIP